MNHLQQNIHERVKVDLYILPSYKRKEEQTHVEEMTEIKISNALKKMKNNKAAGPGDFPAELLKHAPINLENN